MKRRRLLVGDVKGRPPGCPLLGAIQGGRSRRLLVGDVGVDLPSSRSAGPGRLPVGDGLGDSAAASLAGSLSSVANRAGGVPAGCAYESPAASCTSSGAVLQTHSIL